MNVTYIKSGLCSRHLLVAGSAKSLDCSSNRPTSGPSAEWPPSHDVIRATENENA